MSSNDTSTYALGNTQPEDERLAWQAQRFDPLTERFFREAGIAAGQRVLDLGSGAGHVAMLLAKIVGPHGEVVGVERSAISIERAKARTLDAGFQNVTFTQADVRDIPRSDPFDAAVGRFILMFLPDPVPVVRLLSQLVRPGGVLAFHEVSWAAFLERCANLPLCFASAMMIHETFRRTGANTEMGPALPSVFRNAGLPAPTMTSTTLLGNAPDLTKWLVDILYVLEAQMHDLGISRTRIGDIDTLSTRLLAELSSSRGVVGGPDLVGGWAKLAPMTA